MELNRRQFSLLPLLKWFPLGAFFTREVFAQKTKALPGLSESEWRVIGSVADQIFPKMEGIASATEAGALTYISRAITGKLPALKYWRKGTKSSGGVIPYYKRFVQHLNAESMKVYKKNADRLDPVMLGTLLKEFSGASNTVQGYRVSGMGKAATLSDAELFELVARHVKQSYFSEPRHGGNADYAGWKSVGHTCHMNYPDKPDSCPSHIVVED